MTGLTHLFSIKQKMHKLRLIGLTHLLLINGCIVAQNGDFVKKKIKKTLENFFGICYNYLVAKLPRECFAPRSAAAAVRSDVSPFFGQTSLCSIGQINPAVMYLPKGGKPDETSQSRLHSSNAHLHAKNGFCAFQGKCVRA